MFQSIEKEKVSIKEINGVNLERLLSQEGKNRLLLKDTFLSSSTTLLTVPISASFEIGQNFHPDG